MSKLTLSASFPSHPGCKGCEYHSSANRVGIPTIRADEPSPSRIFHASIVPYGNRKKKALLVVGEAPGREEDAMGAPFVGPSGIYLWKVYLEGSGLLDLADVYVGNAIRCRPPGNATPNAGHRKACLPHLQRDISILYEAYPGEVTILCVGATACQQVLQRPLGEALRSQGEKGSFPIVERGIPEVGYISVFSTYHPAYLLPRRNPSAVGAVHDHLSLLIDHLEGVPSAFRKVPRRKPGEVPANLSPYNVVSLDIETYGTVQNQPIQRYFHPDKSMAYDGVARRDLVQTVAVTLGQKRTAPGKRVSCIFVWADRDHRRSLRKLLTTLLFRKSNPSILLGFNLVFDLLYMRASDHSYRAVFNSSVHYADASILSYLHNELRPERDLKSLSTLFKLQPYGRTAANWQWPDALDKELHAYNMQDTENTLALADKLIARIKKDYGAKTPKLDVFTFEWYSRLIWNALRMTEVGVCMDEKKLRVFLKHTRYARRALAKKALDLPDPFNGPIQGVGSSKHVTQFMEAMDTTIRNNNPDDALQRTGIKGTVSTSEANRTQAKKFLKPSSVPHRLLRTLDSHRYYTKIETSYLLPLLEGRGKNQEDQSSRLLKGIAHPSWYLVPLRTEDREGAEGGTNQGRIICKRPALQTAPKTIKKCLSTRFDPGVLLAYDYSQVELRMAALLSGDQEMVQEYLKNLDKHTVTARILFEQDDVTPKMRQVGKTVNFLMLYRGGPYKLQQVLKEGGVTVTASQCTRWIDKFRAHYHHLAQWQDGLVNSACKTGHITMPVLGQSRLFLGSPETIRETYTATICNFPVQCTAANLLISAQDAAVADFRHHNLKAVIGLQIYDALYVECPAHEETTVRYLMDHHLTKPPFRRILEETFHQSVPLRYDVEVLVRRKDGSNAQSPD